MTPRYFEIPFGLPRAEARAAIASREPVSIAIGAGQAFALRGSIDRVDEAPDGSFHVWDYKTGGTWRHKEKRGIHGGRQIQHALYAMALEILLARAGIAAPVSRSGYFFPGRKGEGQRMTMALDPKETREVLSRLFDLLRAGAFPHAVDKEDCRFCDYEAVCGGPILAARALEGETGEDRPAGAPGVFGRSMAKAEAQRAASRRGRRGGRSARTSGPRCSSRPPPAPARRRASSSA